MPSLHRKFNNTLLLYFLLKGVFNATESSMVSKKVHLQVNRHVHVHVHCHVCTSGYMLYYWFLRSNTKGEK